MEIRTIKNGELEIVCKMTHDTYVKEGYIKPQSNGLFLHYEQYDNLPKTTVFVAIENNHIVGTVSLCNDFDKSPLFDDFPKITQSVKHECQIWEKNLAYVYRLVTLDEYRNNRKLIFLLLHSVIRLAFQNKTHISFITVNPKHKEFYDHILGFREEFIDQLDGVNAPAVLMRADMVNLYFKWEKIANRQGFKIDFELPPNLLARPQNHWLIWWGNFCMFTSPAWLLLAIFWVGFWIYDHLFLPKPKDC